jgi:hypothetical protein
MVNIGLMELTAGPQSVAGVTKSAVWVLSAGPNGIIETPYAQSILTATQAGGDDIGIRVQ